jgi:signal transduction histidine kinase
LAELRGIARAQAMELRRGLAAEPDLPQPTTIGEDLTLLATEMAREGLRAQLVFAEIDDSAMPAARRRAVREAAREALRNTMKHSGTNEAVLRIEERDGGIAVIARDHGSGFDDADRPAGFGISESIAARLAEVGGHSHVDSQPGRGTRVTLWVPR